MAASSGSLTGIALTRVRKELKMIYEQPPPGISAWWPHEEDAREIEAGVLPEHPAHLTPCSDAPPQFVPQSLWVPRALRMLVDASGSN